ncbi:MAG: GNAT family N-acetyltransferase [Pseudomonadota bacterium]
MNGGAKPAYDLRAADAGDYPFCERLYIASMQPLLSALDAWDHGKAVRALTEYFKPEEVQIVRMEKEDAGWIQISESEQALHLDQIYLREKFRGRGVGTHLIAQTADHARSVGKCVKLSLIRGNRAATLYQRLGFKQESEDRTKYHMVLATN